MKFLGRKQSNKTDEEIKKELDNKREEMLARSLRLRHLIDSPSPGWNDFVGLIDEYIDACKKRKAVTALDIADDKAIYQLKLLDHDIYILNWVKEIPQQFINKTEEVIKKVNEEKDERA